MKPIYCSRPDKLEHPDTVLYEIYMLRFAAEQLDGGRIGKDAWVYLETFLLHFRNLIEFIGNPKRRGGDLRVETMCPTLTTVRESGIRLFKGYEFVEDRISRYLAHCTETRIVTKQWRVDQMYEELEPLLTQLEVHLNPSPGFLAQMKRIPPYKFRATMYGSTAVGTLTASAVAVLRPSDGSSTISEGVMFDFADPTRWSAIRMSPDKDLSDDAQKDEPRQNPKTDK